MNTAEALSIFRPYQVDGLQRMGNKYDGGYVIHHPSLKLIDCLITYGVGYNTKFEEDFHAATGKPVYAFDPTMTKFTYLLDDFKQSSIAHALLQAKNWAMWSLSVKEKRLAKQQIHFIREGLANKDTKQFKTFGYHLSRYNLLDKKLFLKIDIEGAEYELMKDEDFYTHLDNVAQMVYEFHWMDTQLEKLMAFMKRLEQTHTLVHIHANNFGNFFNYHGTPVAHVIEVTYLHNSLMPADKKQSTRKYPIEGLDAPCTTRRKELIPEFF